MMVDPKIQNPKFDRNLAIERACNCPSYSPSKIRIQEYFVCEHPKQPLDICNECPINGLREPSTIVFSSYLKSGELEDVAEDNEEIINSLSKISPLF